MKDKFYYKDGSILNYWYHTKILHREDGPAIEYANGYKVWFIDGKWLTEEQFNNHPKVQHYRFSVLLEKVLKQ